MNKRIRKLIDNLKYALNSELLKKITIKTKFLKKDSKFTPEKFISLCVFSDTHHLKSIFNSIDICDSISYICRV